MVYSKKQAWKEFFHLLVGQTVESKAKGVGCTLKGFLLTRLEWDEWDRGDLGCFLCWTVVKSEHKVGTASMDRHHKGYMIQLKKDWKTFKNWLKTQENHLDNQFPMLPLNVLPLPLLPPSLRCQTRPHKHHQKDQHNLSQKDLLSLGFCFIQSLTGDESLVNYLVGKMTKSTTNSTTKLSTKLH